MDGGCYILRLYMEGTCKGHTVKPGHFNGYVGKGKRRKDVHQVSPYKGIPDDFSVHFCKYHSLGCDQIVKNRDGELFHGIGVFSIRIHGFSAVSHHTDLMPVFPQDSGKTLAGNRHAVVCKTELFRY